MMSLIANNIDYNLKQLSINEFLIDESSKKQHTVKLNYNFIRLSRVNSLETEEHSRQLISHSLKSCFTNNYQTKNANF